MFRVTTTLSVSIAGGQTVSAASDVIEADAIDSIDIELSADDTPVTVEIQPGASSQLHALLLSSTFYSSDLTYVFNDGSSDADETLTLDGPQMFSAGNLTAISVDPTNIKLTMASTGEAATVSIFVARNAT